MRPVSCSYHNFLDQNDRMDGPKHLNNITRPRNNGFMSDSCIGHVQGMIEVRWFLDQKQSRFVSFFISIINIYQIYQN
jgi:hypothetical protein